MPGRDWVLSGRTAAFKPLLLRRHLQRRHDGNGQALAPRPADDDVVDELLEDPQHHLHVVNVRFHVRQLQALGQLEGPLGGHVTFITLTHGADQHGADVVRSGVHVQVVEPAKKKKA